MSCVAGILLISNPAVYRRDYLDHVAPEIKSFLCPSESILFFPFALFDREADAATAQARFAKIGLTLQSVHQASNQKRAVEKAMTDTMDNRFSFAA